MCIQRRQLALSVQQKLKCWIFDLDTVKVRSFNLCLIVTSVWVYPFILVFHCHLRSQGCQKGKVTQSIFLTSSFLVKLELVMWNAWAVMHLTAFCTVGAFLTQFKTSFFFDISGTMLVELFELCMKMTSIMVIHSHLFQWAWLNFSVIAWLERVNCLWSLYIEWPSPLSLTETLSWLKSNLRTFLFPKTSYVFYSCCCLHRTQVSVCCPF